MEEEARNLLRRIIEDQAWRQLLMAHIRGHGLKLANQLDYKLRLVGDLDLCLRHLREIQRIYTDLGGGDLVSVVRTKLDRFGYPDTRLELGICLFLADRAERGAMETYLDCVCKDFAAVARSRLASTRELELPEDDDFAEFCGDAGNRPLAQQLLNRWLAVALLSLGRPGSPGDARAVTLGLRSRRCADTVAKFLVELRPLVDACGLAIPEPELLGLELPAGWGAGAPDGGEAARER